MGSEMYLKFVILCRNTQLLGLISFPIDLGVASSSLNFERSFSILVDFYDRGLRPYRGARPKSASMTLYSKYLFFYRVEELSLHRV